jgi:hypothetical protein
MTEFTVLVYRNPTEHKIRLLDARAEGYVDKHGNWPLQLLDSPQDAEI